MDIQWEFPKSCGRKGRANEAGISVAIHKNGISEQTCISLSVSAMKRLGWLAGDHVLIGHDEKSIYVKRVTKDGFTLSAKSKGKGESEKLIGTHAQCTVKVSKKLVDKRIAFSAENIVYVENTLIIDKE